MAEINTAKLTGSASNDTNISGRSPSWLAAFKSRFGLQEAPTLRDVLEQALKEDGKTAEAFTPQEREMVLRTLRFGALRVEDVMVPRADIIAIDEQQSLADLVCLFVEAGHSRVPVYRDTLDDLRGMIHIKDLLTWIMGEAGARLNGAAVEVSGAATGDAATPGAEDQTEMSPVDVVLGLDDDDDEIRSNVGALANIELGRVELARPISTTKLKRPLLFVPPSMPAINLFLRMQTTRIHLAMVVDEYGGTDGLVSIEDLVEEIVGDIEDEHDDGETKLFVDHPKLGLVASARAPIDEIEAHLGMSLLDPGDEEYVDTLGGLVFSMVGRVPVRGELVPHRSGIEFEVLDADPRRIKKLRIHTRKRDLRLAQERAASSRKPAESGAAGAAGNAAATASGATVTTAATTSRDEQDSKPG